ncbi:MAG: hypothetical protein ACLTS6_12700 [Anaerobutyricum sp.]
MLHHPELEGKPTCCRRRSGSKTWYAPC